jgi:hypothetical protein
MNRHTYNTNHLRQTTHELLSGCTADRLCPHSLKYMSLCHSPTTAYNDPLTVGIQKTFQNLIGFTNSHDQMRLFRSHGDNDVFRYSTHCAASHFPLSGTKKKGDALFSWKSRCLPLFLCSKSRFDIYISKHELTLAVEWLI